MRERITTWLIAAGLAVAPAAGYAAGLGKLSVHSALGQPLNAEVELLSVSKDDLSGISVRLASADAFREAHIEPVASLSNLKFSIDQRTGGKPVIRITSSQPVSDPFIDMLVELTWASGRLVREFTVLLDPPVAEETKKPVAVVPPAPPVSTSHVEPGQAGEAKPSGTTAQRPERYGPVKAGETLHSIAGKLKSRDVTMDQMLVGLFRENAAAFVAKNMNLLKRGAILKVPDQAKVVKLPKADAVREVRLQVANWHAYRNEIAASAPTMPEKEQMPAGKTSGSVVPKLEAGPPTKEAGKDVLKLSKSEPAPGASAEVRRAADAQARLSALQEQATAREKAIQEANTRVAALEKNIQEMQRLLELKNQALLQLQKQASVPPKGEVPTGQAAPPAMPPKIAPETKAPAPTVPVMPPTPTAPWYQGLLGNPAYVGGGAAALILAGLAWLVVQASRRRRGLTSFEDSIMTGGELRGNVQEKSAGGGAVVDTGDSSFLTDFSQAGLGNIDTHDVDPIAEAEVYMAYGRDAQAEEILKEAMARDPSRHEIHLKLLEIYAGRKNFTAFETIATELYAALGGEPSPIWQKAAELGRRIDPKNPLYTVSVGAPAVEAQVEAGSDAPVSPPAEAHPETPSPEEHASTSPPEGAGTPTPMDSEQLAEFADSGMEFDLAGFSATGPEGSGEAAPSGVSGSESETATAHFPDLDFRLETPPSHPAEEVKAEMPPPLDLSGIDLDLGEPEKVAAPAEAAPTQTAAESPEHGATEIRPAAIDPELWQEVATKLDLARAYIEMGDAEGAKEILQEVVGEGDARQREEANKMLASIA